MLQKTRRASQSVATNEILWLVSDPDSDSRRVEWLIVFVRSEGDARVRRELCRSKAQRLCELGDLAHGLVFGKCLTATYAVEMPTALTLTPLFNARTRVSARPERPARERCREADTYPGTIIADSSDILSQSVDSTQDFGRGNASCRGKLARLESTTFILMFNGIATEKVPFAALRRPGSVSGRAWL
jgi:hypothetical protein